MQQTERASRGGMTLVEIIVAISILSVVVMFAVGALNEASKPTIEASVRAHLLSLGNAALDRIERELSSADFTNGATVTGAWDGTDLHIDNDVATPAVTDVAVGVGTAVQLFPVTGWDPINQRAATGTAVIYQFRPTPTEGTNGADDDRDGLVDEFQLVRIDVASGLTVVILENVLNDTDPVLLRRPVFRQVGFSDVPPQRAQLEVRFSLSQRVGRNFETGADVFVTHTFSKVITLRNLM